MDFKDQLKQLGERVIKLRDNIHTEEATKNAFIMPFLQCLGYDVFNPLEVVPEYVTDIGTKKGEKIDYAIFKNGEAAKLIECKHWKQNLDIHDGQLLRYFHVSKARFGILTNGIQYRFYSDLVEPNKMDEKPFFEFDITDIKEADAEEIKKFHKSYFDTESIVNTAAELKYTREIKIIFNNELKNPSDTFVRFFISQVFPGRATEKVISQFTELVKKSTHQVISEIITERLKNALNKESEASVAQQALPEPSVESVPMVSKVETTVEEMEAFFIIKAILRTKVASSRIAHRDAQSYFSIFLDDNNRKPICRLYLNGTRKYIGVFDGEKKEVKTEIATLDDIYNFSVQLQSAVELYEKVATV
jgi:predicted type IV restriction endonuclease